MATVRTYHPQCSGTMHAIALGSRTSPTYHYTKLCTPCEVEHCCIPTDMLRATQLAVAPTVRMLADARSTKRLHFALDLQLDEERLKGRVVKWSVDF